MSEPMDIEVKESPVELLREIAEGLRKEDAWKDDLKRGIQNRIDYQGMADFENVYALFEKRFFLLVDGFSFDQQSEHFEVIRSAKSNYAGFRIFDNYGLFLDGGSSKGTIVVNVMIEGDAVPFYPIRIRNYRYKVNRDIVDELFREAFHDLLIDPYGFDLDAYIVQK